MKLWIPSGVLLGWMMLAIGGSIFNLNPNQVDLHSILAGPQSGHWLGNDDLGRPIFDRMVVGARTSFLVAVWVVSVSLVVGTVVGTLSAWWGGWVDHVIVRVIDVFLAFPGMLLAIVLSGILGPGIENVVIALVLVGWVGFARLARAQTMSLKQREHVQAAIALGGGIPRILSYHIIPLIAAPLIVEATFGIAGAVIAEAGLSFLGLGVQPPQASWGSMIRDGTRYMLVAPHMVLAPGFTLMLIVLAANLLGDRLRDYMDVRTRFSTRAQSR